jgi:hypothetical protein
MVPDLTQHCKLSRYLSIFGSILSVIRDTYVIAGECFALQNDFVPAVGVWAVERGHEQV